MKGLKERSWLFDDENKDCIIQKLTQEALSKVTRGQRLNDDHKEEIHLFCIVINQLKIGEDSELASMLFRAAIGSELLPGHVSLKEHLTERNLETLMQLVRQTEMVRCLDKKEANKPRWHAPRAQREHQKVHSIKTNKRSSVAPPVSGVEDAVTTPIIHERSSAIVFKLVKEGSAQSLTLALHE